MFDEIDESKLELPFFRSWFLIAVEALLVG